MEGILALATPKKSKNLDVLVNYMISICDLTSSQAEMLGKMFKIYKKTTTDLELKDKKTKDLKKTAK